METLFKDFKSDTRLEKQLSIDIFISYSSGFTDTVERNLTFETLQEITKYDGYIVNFIHEAIDYDVNFNVTYSRIVIFLKEE